MAAILCGACADACSALGKTCEDITNFICPPDKPYPMFLCYAWCLNLPAGLAGIIIAGINAGQPCGNLAVWLFIQFGFCIVNMIFAVYIYRRIANPKPEEESMGLGTRAWRMFMYDPAILCYGVFWIGAVVWVILGSSWLGSAPDSCSGSQLMQMASVMVIICYAFLFGGFFVILMSIMCDCCRDKRPNRHASDNRGLVSGGGSSYPGSNQGRPVQQQAAPAGQPYQPTTADRARAAAQQVTSAASNAATNVRAAVTSNNNSRPASTAPAARPATSTPPGYQQASYA